MSGGTAVRSGPHPVTAAARNNRRIIAREHNRLVICIATTPLCRLRPLEVTRPQRASLPPRCRLLRNHDVDFSHCCCAWSFPAGRIYGEHAASPDPEPGGHSSLTRFYLPCHCSTARRETTERSVPIRPKGRVCKHSIAHSRAFNRIRLLPALPSRLSERALCY